MIQVNLIPDVKAEFLKAQNMRRVVQFFSFIFAAGAASLALFAFFYVSVVQARHTNALQTDIDSLVNDLKNDTDLDKVITVRNQLVSVPGLHMQKSLSSNSIDFFKKITPTSISYTDVAIDFEESVISFEGTGEDTKSVNEFSDVLKFATFTDEDVTEPEVAFPGVVTDVVVPKSEKDEPASFSIDAFFDPRLFDTKSAKLEVPKAITIRSEVERPKDLFTNKAEEE